MRVEKIHKNYTSFALDSQKVFGVPFAYSISFPFLPMFFDDEDTEDVSLEDDNDFTSDDDDVDGEGDDMGSDEDDL